MDPIVSLVVPTWNRLDELKRLMASISIQEGGNHETIVVDNGSGDGTGEYLNSLEGSVRVISNSRNLGAAYAKNQGIKAARGDLVWFLDSDSELYDPQVISRALDIIMGVRFIELSRVL